MVYLFYALGNKRDTGKERVPGCQSKCGKLRQVNKSWERIKSSAENKKVESSSFFLFP